MCEEIVIVSGLPRSGTAMMMQCLAAGGVDVVTDGQREADENNERGYYEDERVLRLEEDVGWLKSVQGKAVKILFNQLDFLPPYYQYRCLWLHRPLKEVLASMQAMCGRPENVDIVLPAWNRWRTKALMLARNMPELQMMVVEYHQVLNNPGAEMDAVQEFLCGFDFDPVAAAGAVDTDMQHQHEVAIT